MCSFHHSCSCLVVFYNADVYSIDIKPKFHDSDVNIYLILIFIYFWHKPLK